MVFRTVLVPAVMALWKKLTGMNDRDSRGVGDIEQQCDAAESTVDDAAPPYAPLIGPRSTNSVAETMHRRTRGLSQTAVARGTNHIRSLAHLYGNDDVVWLAGGFPDPSMFPLKGVSFEIGKTTMELTCHQTQRAQQYMLDNGGAGYAPLVQWIESHVRTSHAPPHDTWCVHITCGNSDAPLRYLQHFMDHGDTLLMEEYSFMHSFSQLAPFVGTGQWYVEALRMDDGGIVPDALETLLNAWHTTHPGRRPPRVLLTIPTGQNPTGTTLSDERVRRIYEIACRHDIVLIEDDPYRLLYYGSPHVNDDAPLPEVHQLPTSFLSIDRDERVVRFDTFSKFMGPGFRVGWVTGPRTYLSKTLDVNLVSSLSQVVLGTILTQWSRDDFHEHWDSVRKEYRRRCRVTLAAARTFLPDSITVVPDAGMYVWLRTPGRNTRALEGSMKQVAVVPGGMFTIDYAASQCEFVRVSLCEACDRRVESGIAALEHAVINVT